MRPELWFFIQINYLALSYRGKSIRLTVQVVQASVSYAVVASFDLVNQEVHVRLSIGMTSEIFAEPRCVHGRRQDLPRCIAVLPLRCDTWC